MNKKKRILFYIGVVGSSIIGIGILILLIPAITNYLPDTHVKGDASAAEISKFNDYYADFSRVADFVLEKHEELPEIDESDGGRTFRVNIEDGRIMHFLAENDAKGLYFDVPFECDEATGDSIKSLGEYFGSELLLANVISGKVLFIYGGTRTIYTSDNSIPKYTYESREHVTSYSIYKLRDNWFLAE